MQRPRAAVQNAQPPCKLQLNDYNFLLPAASLMARSTSLALPIDGWRIGLTRPSPLSLSVPYIFPFGIPIPTPSPSSHYYTCLLILIPYGALMNNGESWGLGVTGRAQYRRTCFFSFLSFFFQWPWSAARRNWWRDATFLLPFDDEKPSPTTAIRFSPRFD